MKTIILSLLSRWYKKSISLFEKLSSKPRIGGLYISDSALQYVSVQGQVRTYAIRIPPGVVREGKIIQKEDAVRIFREFRKMIDPDQKVLVKVIATLPSSLVYTQSFSIPNLGEEKFRESVDLNLQMLSPIPKDEAYMSSEVIHAMEDRYELLGAFAEKKHIDMYRAIFEESGFYPIALEFPGLALTRLTRTMMGDASFPVLIFSLSSDGLNVMILRNGALYFDYFRSWQSVQGDQKEIPQSVFEDVIVHEIQKVIHFSLGRFKETPERIFLVAPGLLETLQGFLRERFGIPIVPLMFESWQLASQWYVALGSALRGTLDRSEDRAISVAPQGSLQVFYEEQTLHFIHLWRNISVSALSFFFIMFGFSAYFLVRNVNGLKIKMRTVGNEPKNELVAMMNRAREFNALVHTVANSRSENIIWHTIIERLHTIADRERVVIDKIDVQGLRSMIIMHAHASDYDTVSKFQNAISLDMHFVNVTLPPSSVVSRDDGAIGFTLNARGSFTTDGSVQEER